jgi:hypothetical protein
MNTRWPNKSRGRVKTPGQRADGRLGGWKFYSFGVSRWRTLPHLFQKTKSRSC